MKIRQKGLASTLITLAIVAMLIISGPAQAVKVSIFGLKDRYVQGDRVNFTVSIEIRNTDRYVPATNISIDITGPTNKSRVFLLDGTPISGDTNITITPVPSFVPALGDFGYGYGFGCDNQTDSGPCYPFGYGYGYGNGTVTLTYKYNVTVNSTYLSWGNYTATASLNTGKAIKPSFNSTPEYFEILIPITMEITPKKINPMAKGVIKATIYNNTPPSFDVTSINISTVEFGPAKAKAFKNETPADKKLMLHFRTEETGIRCGDTEVNLTGRTITGLGIFGSVSIETVCPPPAEEAAGGGGAGVVTGESFENIAKSETRDRDLVANRPVTYIFVSPEIDIYQVVVTGKETEYAVSLRVELLKGLSKLAKAPAPGIVYSYLNVWSGSKRIGDVLIRYRVKNIWIEDNKLVRTAIRLLVWSEDKWKPLETSEIGRDDVYTYFEAKTTGLSIFAIAGILVAPTPTPEVITPTPTPVITPTPTPKKPTPGFETIVAVTAIALVYLLGRKRRQI